MAKNIMIQGTSSSVGKSILTAALCRIFTQDGYDVAPFKSQNMSLNSHVTVEGHEMGRAQVLQAEASRKVPHVAMNPILLKPSTDHQSQVIVMGKVLKDMTAADYFAYKQELKEVILAAYRSLSNKNDIIVIEGAGSPAEINLNKGDIVNMGLAEMVDAPVILVADIDRGGVFASIYGTVMLLEEKERKRIKGIIINKFRGDQALLMPGIDQIESLTGIKVLGIIPYFSLDLDEEDSAMDWSKFSETSKAELEIVVIRLPHLSNFTDFHPLSVLEEVNLRFVDLNEEIGHPDLLILPGTKSTVEDLMGMKESGMDRKIMQCHENGTSLLGICGGYQILGKTIKDPHGVETTKPITEGLGIIDMDTSFKREKNTFLVEGKSHFSDSKIFGYEIHMGESNHKEKHEPLVTITKRNTEEVRPMTEGIMDKENGVFGTYVHGIFDNGSFTRDFLNYLCHKKGIKPLQAEIRDFWIHRDAEIEKLENIVRENLNMEKVYEILNEY